MTNNTPLTEQTVLAPAVNVGKLVPRLISENQPILYFSKSLERFVIGIFAGYIAVNEGQLGVVIQVAGDMDRNVPLRRLLKPESSTSHPDGSPVLFSIKVPPKSQSGERYRTAILKSFWSPEGVNQKIYSNLRVTVEVAEFSTTYTGHLNDHTVEVDFDMPSILKLNI